MRPTVISDFVAFTRGARNDLRMFCDIFADHEESCFNLVSRKDVQQFRSKRCAGPIIESHRDVWAIDVDETEGDTRFRQGIRAVLFRNPRCNWRFCSKLSRDKADKTEEDHTGDGHERTWRTDACIYQRPTVTQDATRKT